MSYEAKEHYQKEEVADAYDRVRFRGLKGALVNCLEQRLLVRALSGLRSGGLVLDLPVGTGRMSRRLAAQGYRPVGADISAPMLRLAARLAGKDRRSAQLVCSDGEALPFADGSFDGVVCFRLMSHLPREARVTLLREMARVAADRVVAVYQPHKIAAWWLVYGGILGRRLPLHYASAGELEREFADAGLRSVRSHALLRWVFMERAYVLEPVQSG